MRPGLRAAAASERGGDRVVRRLLGEVLVIGQRCALAGEDRRNPGVLVRVVPDGDPDALLHGSLSRFSQTPSLRGYLGQLYAISFWTALPWLRRLRHPTLVLAGDDDPIVPALNGRILAHRIPDSRLHIVAGGGHLFLLERPADMARQVADFLHRNPDDTHPPATINDENEQDR